MAATGIKARAEAAAREGLALLASGDVAGGLRRYRLCLRRESRNSAPVGLHIRFLEHAGRSEAAAELRRLALKVGADVAVAASGPADAAADEYRRLFESGTGNATMAAKYLEALAQLGRVEEAQALFDPARLLRIVRVPDPDPDAIQAVLIREEGRAEFQEAVQSIRSIRKLEGFHRLPDPPVRALMRALARESRAYLHDWAESGHPFARLTPRRFRINAWGLISRGDGFNVPHIHHKGWATGVYYPAAPNGPGGELLVGSAGGRPGDEGPVAAEIRPEPGLLVLMPSYATHWTRRLASRGLRTAIAFDLIDSSRALSAAAKRRRAASG